MTEFKRITLYAIVEDIWKNERDIESVEMAKDTVHQLVAQVFNVDVKDTITPHTICGHRIIINPEMPFGEYKINRAKAQEK